jgi:peptidyl-prolyl cis-trans isomerase D
MGFVVSLEEVKNEIKSMPYFKTNNQFDVNLYRNMLQGNGYTPTQFEELIANDLKQKKIDELFNSTIVSEEFVKDVARFKGNQVVVQAVKISRQGLAPLVSISEQEIKDYLTKTENQKALETAYTENISKYNRPEEVKARHILLAGEDVKNLEKAKALRAKLNPKNFADIAKKETQDPTGKANGGDLGWFGAGRMVPEFEKVAFKMKKGEISEPVKTQFGYHLIMVEDKKAAETQTMDAVKPELARLAIQKTKAQDLDKLLKTTGEQLEQQLKNNDFAAVEALSKKVDGQIFKDAPVNQFDQNLGQVTLSPKEADEIFKTAPGTVLNFGNPGTVFLVKVLDKKIDVEKNQEQMKAEIASQNQTFSRRIREDLIKSMNNKAKVVTNPNLL